MTWRRIDDKVLSEPMVAWFTDRSMRFSDSLRCLGLKEKFLLHVMRICRLRKLNMAWIIDFRDRSDKRLLACILVFTSKQMVANV